MTEVMLAQKMSRMWADHYMRIEDGAHVQLKIDGMRCVFGQNFAMTRTLRRHKSLLLEDVRKDFLSLGGPWKLPDGEIIAGLNTFGGSTVFRQTMSLRARDFKSPLTFYLFDDAGRTTDYNTFYNNARDWFAEHGGLETVNDVGVLTIERQVFGVPVHYCLLPSFVVRTYEALQRFEETFIAAGAEGLIFRRKCSPYRNGRQTASSGNLMKLKRWEESEGIIIGFKELYSNQNEKTTAPNGMSQRSSHQENKIPMGTLGAFEVSFLGNTFSLGSGFTEAERDAFWSVREKLLGKKVTFKHFDQGGYDAPRHPIFKAIRDDE